MEFKVKVFRYLKYFGPKASEFQASKGPSQQRKKAKGTHRSRKQKHLPVHIDCL